MIIHSFFITISIIFIKFIFELNFFPHSQFDDRLLFFIYIILFSFYLFTNSNYCLKHNQTYCNKYSILHFFIHNLIYKLYYCFILHTKIYPSFFIYTDMKFFNHKTLFHIFISPIKFFYIIIIIYLNYFISIIFIFLDYLQ
jgi:hypothetical protein